MIYTVTLNPSIDYIMRVPCFETGEINRSDSEAILPGGKGINVSWMLKNLNVPNVALGFTAGFTGAEIERLLLERGVQADFVRLEGGMSRINLKIKAEQETEVNGGGPDISKKALNELFNKIQTLSNDDILVLAGSVPKSIPQTVYAEIAAMLQNKNIKLIVDGEKSLLLPCLAYKPHLAKPNLKELSEFFGCEMKSLADVKCYALELQKLGVQNVLVSLAGDGAILASEDGNVYFCPAPKGKVINSTGAGDSALAGFLAAVEQKCIYSDCLRFAVCAGSATAFSLELASNTHIFSLFNRTKPDCVKFL